MNDHLDILAFGAHADDVEIGMGGTLAKFTKAGLKVGICDLTLAQYSSNGTVEQRKQEATVAGERLGIKVRLNLGFQDRELQFSHDKIEEIVKVIRKYQPKVVTAPYYEDRHPDHGNCAKLIEEAVFSAGIRKFLEQIPKHSVQKLYFYMINGFHRPSFYVDISNELEMKVNSLKAYESQFVSAEQGVVTPLTDGYIETVISRDRLFGKQGGVKYAEGFISKTAPFLKEDFFGE